MVLPILISVSVAPASYFFWASALLPLAASKIMAVENAATCRTTKDISFLPIEINESVCLLSETSVGLLSDLEHLPLRLVDHNGRRSIRDFGVSWRDPSM